MKAFPLLAAALLAGGCVTKVSVVDSPNAALASSGPRVPLKACFVPDRYDTMKSGRRFAVAKWMTSAGGIFSVERANFEGLDEDCDVKLVVNTMKPAIDVFAARSGRGLFSMKGSFGFDAYPKMHAALKTRFEDAALVSSVTAERPGAGGASAAAPSPGRLGLVLASDASGAVAVADVQAGTPAAEAGLKTGDRIVSVGDLSAQTMTLGQAVARLRGEPGTSVSLAYRRGGGEPLTVTLTRRLLDAPAAAQAPAPPAPPADAPKEPVSDVDAPKGRAAQRPDDFALVIGIDEYQSLPKADYGVRDAKTMRRHLEALGFPPRNIISLEGAQATGNKLKSYLEEWLPLNVKPESTLFVFYSGHGAPDPKTGDAYLVPWDGDPAFLKSTAYPLSKFYADLSKTKAKRVLVALDACFSGAGGRSVLAQGARPLVAKVAQTPAGDRVTVLAAASGEEITGSLNEQGHGMFTYFLLKALSEGKRTARELHDSLSPRVQDEARRQNRQQTPALIGEDAAL